MTLTITHGDITNEENNAHRKLTEAYRAIDHKPQTKEIKGFI